MTPACVFQISGGGPYNFYDPVILQKKLRTFFFSFLCFMQTQTKSARIYIGLDDDLWQNFVIECIAFFYFSAYLIFYGPVKVAESQRVFFNFIPHQYNKINKTSVFVNFFYLLTVVCIRICIKGKPQTRYVYCVNEYSKMSTQYKFENSFQI